MINSYNYVYLALSLIYLAIWTVVFYKKHNLRRQILFVSLIGAVLAPFAEYIYTYDWWQPITITGTRIGIEDFIFGFAFAGMTTAILKPNVLFIGKLNIAKCALIVSLSFAVFAGAFFVLDINSFYSTILVYVAMCVVFFTTRTDLIKSALKSGVVVLITAIVVYGLLNIVFPGWIYEYYTFDNLPRILILSLSPDDFLWYFLSGLLWSTAFEYVHNIRQ